MDAKRERHRAIRMLNDLEHVVDILASRKMDFGKADDELQQQLRALATTITKKLKPLVNQKP